MDRIIHIILIVILVVFYLWISRMVEKKYFKKKIHPISSLLDQNLLGIPALTSPKSYFRKETFWKGYFIYLFSFVLAIISVYLLVKLIW